MTNAYYLSISGKEVLYESEKTKEEVIDDFLGSITPLVRINDVPYWDVNSLKNAFEDALLDTISKDD